MRLFSTKKEQLYKQELAWMRRQPQARATKQQARINRFHDLKKEVSGGVAETDLTMNFETSRIGKKVIEFRMFHLPMKTSLFCKILISWCRLKIVLELLGTTVLGNQLSLT